MRAVLEAVADGRLERSRAEQLIGRLVLERKRPERWRDELESLGISVADVERADRTDRAVAARAVAARHGRDAADLEAVVGLIRSELGEPGSWDAATRYASVALATIDSIWSINARYQGVLNVIERYRALRRADGYDPEADTPADLASCIEGLGGPQAFADAVRNRQRTSTRSGILKAEAVLFEARALATGGIGTPTDVVACPPARLDALRESWTAVPGQASGITWDYFLMLCGLPGVKADRMLQRFVSRALGREVTADRAGAIVLASAEGLGVASPQLDYRIWRQESTRSTRG